MVKNIPYTDYYYDFNLDSIKDKNGEIVPIGKNKTINLSINGVEKKINIDWLKYLAMSNICLPSWAEKYLLDLKFAKLTKPNINLEKFTCYTDKGIRYPYNSDYRLIPRYPRYVISKTGKLIDTETDEEVIPTNALYKRVRIFDPFQQNFVNVQLHRLVAYAWVPNSNWEQNMVINHINGDKYDIRPENLEWCTYADNINHAFTTKLRNDNILCYTRNVDTLEEKSFVSISKAMEWIGRSRLNLRQSPICPHTLICGTNGRFEIKFDDISPWYFTTPPSMDYRPYANLFEVIFQNGDKRVYTKVSELLKLAHISRAYSVKDAINVVLKKRSDIKDIIVTSLKADTSNGIEARNIDTGEIKTARTSKELSNEIHLGKSTVIKAVKLNNPKRLFLGWQIRIVTNEPWPEPDQNQPVNIASSYKVTNLTDGNITICKSLRDLESKVGLARRVIAPKLKLDSTIRHNDYLIESIISPNKW